MKKRKLPLVVFLPLVGLFVMVLLMELQEPLGQILPQRLVSWLTVIGGFVSMGVMVWSAVFLSNWFRQTQARSLHERTGKSLDDWVILVLAQGPDESAVRRAWLAQTWALDEKDAGYIASEAAHRELIEAGKPDPRVAVWGCVLVLMLLIMAVSVGMAWWWIRR